MKSYTDLEQSKKLAEILPLESADNYYSWHDERYYVVNKDCPYPYSLKEKIPCWSLAALLDVLPQIDEWITPYGCKDDKLFQFDPKICKIWEHSITPSYKVTYSYALSTDIYDNLVDACYEMILKLHELNLL